MKSYLLIATIGVFACLSTVQTRHTSSCKSRSTSCQNFYDCCKRACNNNYKAMCGLNENQWAPGTSCMCKGNSVVRTDVNVVSNSGRSSPRFDATTGSCTRSTSTCQSFYDCCRRACNENWKGVCAKDSSGNWDSRTKCTCQGGGQSNVASSNVVRSNRHYNNRETNSCAARESNCSAFFRCCKSQCGTNRGYQAKCEQDSRGYGPKTKCQCT